MTETLNTTSKQQNIEQTKGHERLLQAYEIYNNLAKGKIDDFKKAKDYLAGILERLFQEGKIGRGVLILSRVKSPSSVVKNWKLGKNLDDILGITLLTAEQEEMDEIRKVIREENKFDISCIKEMKEKRGYEATHFKLNVGEGNKKTKVECHLQTHEAYRTVYTHIFYKVRRELKRDLKPEEESMILEKIQSMYDNGELSGYNLEGGKKSKIPQMWVASFNEEGKMEEQELDEDIILTIMYPFLDISKKNLKPQTSNAEVQDQDELEI